jgi:lipopolysaccharide transport system ATP-binding protein
MYVRLAFAVAAHLEPDILIVDEVLAVGDSQFQKKCMGKMQSVSEQEGRTVLFVSHNMQAIRQMCGRVILMKQGKLAYEGDPHVAISSYLGQGVEGESAAIYDLTHYPRGMTGEGGRLLRLRFVNGQGRPAASIFLADVLTVEVDFVAQKHMQEFSMSMAVIHGEGLRVFSETYTDQYEPLDLKPGEYTVRFHVPMRFFKMESYFLSVTLVDSGRVCDHLEGLLMPEIVDENPNLHTETNRWGVLRVPVTWDVVKPAAPSP